MLLSILNIHENLKQKKGSVNSIHKDAINKSTEQRLNLRRSQHKGYSTFYNTPFLFKSSAQDLSPKILDFGQGSTSMVFPHISALRRRKTGSSILVRLRLFRGSYRCFLAPILTQRHSVIIEQMVASHHCLFKQVQVPIV